MEINFHIICTGYNCAKYVRGCVQSVLAQTYDNWTLHMIDDGTPVQYLLGGLKRYGGYGPKIKGYQYTNNEGAGKRRYEVIKRIDDPNAVILLLGMDDELLPDALATIAEQYRDGKLMTYGNWMNQNGMGLPEGFVFTFPDAVHDVRAYRLATYRSTNPNTFYKFLFDRIPEDDFKLDGEWIKTATEAETMFSCMEMAGRDRIGIITKPIYMYRQNLPNNSQSRWGQAYKNTVYARVCGREPKPLLEV